MAKLSRRGGLSHGHLSFRPGSYVAFLLCRFQWNESAAEMRLSIQALHLLRSVTMFLVNAEYSIWRAKILSDERLKFCEKLSANGTRRRRLTIAACVSG